MTLRAYSIRFRMHLIHSHTNDSYFLVKFLSKRIQVNIWFLKFIFNSIDILFFISINDTSRWNWKRKVIKSININMWSWRHEYIYRNSWLCHQCMNFQAVKIFLSAGNMSPEAFILIYFASSYADVSANRDRKTVCEINLQCLSFVERCSNLTHQAAPDWFRNSAETAAKLTFWKSYQDSSRKLQLFSWLPEKKAATVRAAVMTSAVLIAHCRSFRN